MTRKERYTKVASLLAKRFPNAEYELHFDSTYQLMVAITLAARCSDKLVNEISPRLFSRFPSVNDLAKANEKDVFDLIKEVTYPESKANYLIEAAKIIVEKYNGEIPNQSLDLQQLPGIGRKSANTILAEGFYIPAIAVDTHIARVSQRIGFTASTNPDMIEKDLCLIIPRENWITDSHRLILFGRYLCTSKEPKCEECPIKEVCITHTQEKEDMELLF